MDNPYSKPGIDSIGETALIEPTESLGSIARETFLAWESFFAGPIIETYVTWLGFRAKWLRATMFVLGTSLSCLLAFAAVATHLIPDMD